MNFWPMLGWPIGELTGRKYWKIHVFCRFVEPCWADQLASRLACVRHGLHISCACENSDWWCMPFVNVETKEEVTCGHAWFSLIGFLKKSRMGVLPEACWIPVGFWPCASRIPAREICMFPSYTNFLPLFFIPPISLPLMLWLICAWRAHNLRMLCACGDGGPC